MKKTLLFLLLALSTAACQQPIIENSCVDFPEFPRQVRLKVTEQPTAFTTSFEVSYGPGLVAKVSEETWTTTKEFHLIDVKGNKIAMGKTEAFTFGSITHVTDCRGRAIGTFKQEVLESILSLQAVYSILKPDGSIVGESRKSEFFSTDITIRDSSGKTLAALNRPAFNWGGDDWTVSVQDAQAVDPRLAVMIAVFKTKSDNDRKAKESRKRDDDKSSSGSRSGRRN